MGNPVKNVETINNNLDNNSRAIYEEEKTF